MILKLIAIIMGLVLSGLVNASVITGGGGYELGNKYEITKDTQTIIHNDAIVYQVLSRDSQYEHIFLRVNKLKIIHRITIVSHVLAEKACYAQMGKIQEETETLHPGLKYYAMGENEMFFDSERTFTIECNKVKGGWQLRLEYADDTLAKE